MTEAMTMPYTADRPPLRETVEQLRARIPGWGVDSDPRDRPSVPREQPGIETGAHWDFPERQPEKQPRERSIEHEFLTPVFGTVAPLKGLSGAMRKYAYKYSEARAAHWLILMAADRVDAWESRLGSLGTAHPDNPIAESGVLSEFFAHGLKSRRGSARADTKHQWMDPLLAAGPWLLAGAAVVRVLKARRATSHRLGPPLGSGNPLAFWSPPRRPGPC